VWWDVRSLLHYKFTAESVWEEFLKSLNIWKSYGGKVDCLKWPMRALGHCPAERWRTRLKSDVWQAGTVVPVASRYDQYSSLTLTPWPNWYQSYWCNVNHLWRIDWCHQWLNVIVCAGVWFVEASSWLMDVRADSHCFLSMNNMMLTSLGDFFSYCFEWEFASFSSGAWQLLSTHSSQSSVATRLRCGGNGYLIIALPEIYC